MVLIASQLAWLLFVLRQEEGLFSSKLPQECALVGYCCFIAKSCRVRVLQCQ